MEQKQCTKCEEVKDINEFYAYEHFYKRENMVRLKFRAQCKECDKRDARQWALNNPEKQKESVRKSELRPERKQKQLEKAKTPKAKENQKKWRQENLDKMRVYNQNHRAKKKELVNDLSLEQWNNCVEFFGHCCAYCGLSEEENRELTGKGLEQEHILPMSKGGGYTIANIIPACRGCNGSKHKNNFEDWYPQQVFYNEKKGNKIIEYLTYALTNKYFSSTTWNPANEDSFFVFKGEEVSYGIR